MLQNVFFVGPAFGVIEGRFSLSIKNDSSFLLQLNNFNGKWEPSKDEPQNKTGFIDHKLEYDTQIPLAVKQ